MITDDSIMVVGKFKFWKIKDVPSWYLIKIHDNGGINSELREYLKANIDRIKERIEEPIRQVEVLCEKISFPTEKEAKFRMKHIQKISKRDSVPIRAYECEVCGAWHLTSAEYRTAKQH